MLRTLRLRPLAVSQFVANMYDTHIFMSVFRRRHRVAFPMNSIWILGTDTPEQTWKDNKEAKTEKTKEKILKERIEAL